MGKIISTLLFQPPENPTTLASSKYFWLKTSRGSQIPAFHIKQSHARFTILYSHGNAEDLGMIYNYVSELSRLLYVNILAYDYTGYGLGTRNPENIQYEKVESSEENCYADIEASYDYLTNVKHIDPLQIILYGRSVGSGPSCYLAQKLGNEMGELGLGGMILHSPFVSVCRVVVDLGLENKFDLFPNVSRTKDITCPTFIIHGTKDGVVPFYHGRMIYENLPEEIRYKPFWAESMGHNNIESEMCSLFIKKLQSFFLYIIKTKVPLNSQFEKLSKRRKRQVEIMVNNFPELEVEVSPKAKLNRTESPKSVAEANDHKFVFDSISPHMSPAIEFGEIECSVMPELE
jgi:pimeloyl-ACP methyl ester carboxylesterase